MAGTDLISALPLEIKVSILCCLKVKYAVRTSAMAQSWRHLWTLLPCLRLRIFKDLRSPHHYREPSDWFKHANYLISSLRGPLLIFKLAHFFIADHSALLQCLLHLLLQKGGVQTLGFCSYDDGAVLRLPSFQSLKELRLRRCHVVLPTGFQGFNSLTTLALRDVKISNGDLHLLNHTSNKLTRIRYLNLVASEDPLSVTISSPLLRRLEFGINESLDKICTVSAPCLEQARIFIRDSRSEKLARLTLGLVTSVSMVSSLKLDCYFLEISFICCQILIFIL